MEAKRDGSRFREMSADLQGLIKARENALVELEARPLDSPALLSEIASWTSLISQRRRQLQQELELAPYAPKGHVQVFDSVDVGCEFQEYSFATGEWTTKTLSADDVEALKLINCQLVHMHNRTFRFNPATYHNPAEVLERVDDEWQRVSWAPNPMMWTPTQMNGVDGALFIHEGGCASGSGHSTGMFRLDIDTRQWKVCRPIPLAPYGIRSIGVGSGAILAVNMTSDSEQNYRVALYDITRDNWVCLASMPVLKKAPCLLRHVAPSD